jgi:hypothetical protein
MLSNFKNQYYPEIVTSKQHLHMHGIEFFVGTFCRQVNDVHEVLE